MLQHINLILECECDGYFIHQQLKVIRVNVCLFCGVSLASALEFVVLAHGDE